ncbi:GH11426 [Drosophila grimshawi]|uniref:GH11426 n=2 Tax=Drosophila grimshawi TaxID=7222 RepID=B4JAB1_DROGR|nr:GH11426 [Drosophila grimshawi]
MAGLCNCSNYDAHQEALEELKYVVQALESEKQLDNNHYAQPAARHARLEPILTSCSTEGDGKYVKNREVLFTTLNENLSEHVDMDIPAASDRDAQLDTLTDLVRQTMLKLDNYIEQQAEQKQQNIYTTWTPYSDQSMLGKLEQQCKCRRKGFKLMPVIIMPPPAPPAPPVVAKPQASRSRFSRKKRISAEAFSNSAVSHRPKMRDSGTTMWCPCTCCCNSYGGVTQSLTHLPNSAYQTGALQDQVKVQPATPIPRKLSTQSRGNSRPASQSAEQQQEINVCYCSDAPGQRPRCGKVSFPATEDEEEQENKTFKPEMKAEQVAASGSLDDWFKNAEKSLAMLEKQEKYFSNNESDHPMMTEVYTSHKLLQTESRISMGRDVHFMDTSEKSVSTSDLQQERDKRLMGNSGKSVCQMKIAAAQNPVKIVQIFKSRCGRVLSNKKAKIRFVQQPTEQAKGEAIVVPKVIPNQPRSSPPLPKCRVLKSMCEALPNDGNCCRYYCPQKAARADQLPDEILNNRQVAQKAYKISQYESACGKRLRAKGGQQFRFTYPTQ